MAAYFWKRNLPVPAQMAGEYLEELEKKHSALTPEIVLEESRDENAVLHKCFEWDDAKAAEGYRLVQARNIIRNITVKIEKQDSPALITRAFVNVQDESTQEKGRFVSVEIAVTDEEMKKQVLKNALYELQLFKNKYAECYELGKIFADIEELEKTLSA